jgi:hypothetical protein
MSNPYSFHPKVNYPTSSNNAAQLRSEGFQTPFFFGGSQVPSNLLMPTHHYNGSQGTGFHKGVHSKTHKGDYDFTTKIGDLVYHQDGHYVKEKQHPYGKGFHKGTKSKTHKGDLDFTTKKGDKVFHRKGHNVKLPHTLPFAI